MHHDLILVYQGLPPHSMSEGAMLIRVMYEGKQDTAIGYHQPHLTRAICLSVTAVWIETVWDHTSLIIVQ